MKEKLKVLVSEPCSFGDTNFSSNEQLIKSYIASGHKVCQMGYLHGKVESAVGYDIGLCLNAELCSDLEKEKYIEGIYDVEVIGYEKPCKAFLWVASGFYNRCLIVDINDSKSVEYAQKCYDQKVNHL